MADEPKPTYEQLWKMGQVMGEVFQGLALANKAMLAKLDASDPLTPAQTAIVREWLLQIDVIEEAGTSQLMDLRSTGETTGSIN